MTVRQIGQRPSTGAMAARPRRATGTTRWPQNASARRRWVAGRPWRPTVADGRPVSRRLSAAAGTGVRGGWPRDGGVHPPVDFDPRDVAAARDAEERVLDRSEGVSVVVAGQ